jgi:broad specificity phosphatase PhoE
MGRLYLVRHGQTTSNAEGIIQGPRIDSELSTLGRSQAKALARALEDTELDAVYSSPMRRARDTAAPIANSHHDMEVRMVPELYEMDYGAYCGQPYEGVRDAIAQLLDAWELGFTNEPFPNGESPVVAQHRLKGFAERLSEHVEREDVAVVAHGRVNRILTATFTGVGLTKLEQLPQDNANISILEMEDNEWRTERWNDTSHLDDCLDSFS